VSDCWVSWWGVEGWGWLELIFFGGGVSQGVWLCLELAPATHSADQPFLLSHLPRTLHDSYGIVATRGTASALEANGVKCEKVFKISEGR